MDSKILEATLQVLINDQAYLYALIREQQSQFKDNITQEVFEAWQDDWKKETAANIERLLTSE